MGPNSNNDVGHVSALPNKKVWVVFNPSSGNGKCRHHQTELEALFAHYNFEPLFIPIKQADAKLSDISTQETPHAVIAMGGDGTIQTVANYLVGLDTPLGIIPTGTFNHLAKDLQLPLELEESLKVIQDYHVEKVDVAEVNGHYFLNNSSIGLYPKALKSRKLYSGLVKWLAMTVALVDTFIKFPLLRVNYRFEDKDFEVITPLVFISNNLYKLDLLSLSERHTLKGAQLVLYIMHCPNRLTFVKLLFNIMLRKRKKVAGSFKIQAVESCHLALAKAKVDVAMDGELLRLTTPLRYCIHPRHLSIITLKKDK